MVAQAMAKAGHIPNYAVVGLSFRKNEGLLHHPEI